MMDDKTFFETIDDAQYALFDAYSQKLEYVRMAVDDFEETRDPKFIGFATEEIAEIRENLSRPCTNPDMQIVLDFVSGLVDAEEERLKKLRDN